MTGTNHIFGLRNGQNLGINNNLSYDGSGRRIVRAPRRQHCQRIRRTAYQDEEQGIRFDVQGLQGLHAKLRVNLVSHCQTAFSVFLHGKKVVWQPETRVNHPPYIILQHE